MADIRMNASEVDALARDLEAVGPKVMAMVRNAVKKSAFDVQRLAQMRAPYETGALKNSIGVTFGGNAHGASATIGPTVHYAPYLEYGTHKMAAQPYMRPAADAVAPSFAQAIAEIGANIV